MTRMRAFEENIGALSEEAEDQPRREMVYVMAALWLVQVGIVFTQLQVKPVEPACGPDVAGVFPELLDGRDAGWREEKAEMVRKIRYSQVTVSPRPLKGWAATRKRLLQFRRRSSTLPQRLDLLRRR
jgi:hypothetical protein